MNTLRVFVGYDEREATAFHVLCSSIIRHATGPVSITPLVQPALRSAGLYWRERGPTESTAFSLTRFLVPALCDYDGWAVFMDSDMLCLADMTLLWLDIAANPDKALLVCPHDYVPKAGSKMDGKIQTAYPRKNQSSLMLMNASRCRVLSPSFVNQATGLELHRFLWLKDDEIGSLDLGWNHLVGEYRHNDAAKILHYTLGTPNLPGYERTDHAEDWFAELRLAGLDRVYPPVQRTEPETEYSGGLNLP